MGLSDLWKKKDDKKKVKNLSDEEWEQEIEDQEKLASGQVFSSEYGWRSKEWLDKKRDKNKKKKKLKYSREENDKIMDEYEKEIAAVRKKYNVGDMRYGYGTERYILDDDYHGSYDYSFGGKATGGSSMKEYERTGEWKGYNYYKKATVDYKYIEQMANAFSAQHNITVKVGRNWCINLKAKEMMYDPTSLMFGTKADVIVRLLHEIGHLRHSSPSEDLTGPYRDVYKEACHNVWNTLEDVRIDEKMMKSYEGAPEVYEALKKERADTATKIKKKAEEIRQRAVSKTKEIPSLAELNEAQLKEYCSNYKLDYAKVKALIGGGHTEMVDNLLNLSMKKMDEANVLDYAYGMLLRGNGHSREETPIGVREYIEKTDHVIEKIKIAETSQDVMDILEKEVFPVIETLLKNHEEGTEEDQDLFGKNGAKEIQKGRFGSRDNQVHQSRFDPGQTETPQEWQDGDYSALKESVDSAIKELTRKLKNIRAKDMTPNWKKDERRGKLNIKAIHRYPSGRFDIFKKRQLQMDRTKNFVFSIIVDTSGSMDGDRIINAVRGSIILAEVFKNLDMPFEVMNFDYGATTIKDFNDKYDTTKKTKVGRLVQANGGSTNLLKAFQRSTITTRPERNKYVIVLTDGATNGQWECEETMREWQKKYSVTPVGLNLDTGYTSLSNIMGEENTKDIEEANELPTAFESIIKGIIKKLK